MDNEYQYVPLYSKNEEWITCTYDRYKLAQREGCSTRILTPAPLSEQKQEGETINVQYLSKRWCELNVKAVERYGSNPNCFGGQRDGYIQGYHEASQNTAKQLQEKESEISRLRDSEKLMFYEIDQYKARIVALKAEILTLKNK